MKKVVDGMLFNTKKAHLVRKVKFAFLCHAKYYKTDNDNWFEVLTFGFLEPKASRITGPMEMKQRIALINPDAYERIYGNDIEEA